MSPPVTSPIIRVACRSVARLIQVFGIYVVVHGHSSPGGGFQGGALLATAAILLRIGEGRIGSEREFPERLALPVGSVGVLLFAVVGLTSLFNGGVFLDYARVPLPGLDTVSRHYWSILMVEIGVAVAVMSILIAVFDRLIERASDV